MCPKTDATIMPKSIAPLTDIQVRTAKPRDREAINRLQNDVF